MKRTALLFLFVMAACFAQAQGTQCDASLTRKTIRIGEQDTLRLRVSYQEGTKKKNVIWPPLVDTLIKAIEIVKKDTVHKQLVNHASVLYEQTCNVVITAFDSGTFIIPPQRFVVDKDTVKTSPVVLYVSIIPVDTTKPIRDIHNIYDVPPAPVAAQDKNKVNWWLWGILSAVIIAGVVIFLMMRRKKEAPAEPVAQGTSRHLLPHERTLEKLDALERKKLWQNGQLMEYHVELVDILRDWMKERYSIHAKEMTSGEIITALNGHRADASAVMLMERILRTADMVKFAKQMPGAEDNERSMQLARDFVQATAVIPQPVLQLQPQQTQPS